MIRSFWYISHPPTWNYRYHDYKNTFSIFFISFCLSMFGEMVLTNVEPWLGIDSLKTQTIVCLQYINKFLVLVSMLLVILHSSVQFSWKSTSSVQDLVWVLLPGCSSYTSHTHARKEIWDNLWFHLAVSSYLNPLRQMFHTWRLNYWTESLL